jgi:hypothetical protein
MNRYYTGQSGIYEPTGPVKRPIPAEREEILVAEVELGPAATTPDSSIPIKTGLPAAITIPNFFLLKKPRGIYTRNIKK